MLVTIWKSAFGFKKMILSFFLMETMCAGCFCSLLHLFIICGCKHRYSLNHPPDPLSVCAHRAQKRACELPYGCMGFDQGPLEEKPLLVNSWASSPECFVVFWDKVLNLQWSSCHTSGWHHHSWFICLSLFLRCYQAASMQRGITTGC